MCILYEKEGSTLGVIILVSTGRGLACVPPGAGSSCHVGLGIPGALLSCGFGILCQCPLPPNTGSNSSSWWSNLRRSAVKFLDLAPCPSPELAILRVGVEKGRGCSGRAVFIPTFLFLFLPLLLWTLIHSFTHSFIPQQDMEVVGSALVSGGM